MRLAFAILVYAALIPSGRAAEISCRGETASYSYSLNVEARNNRYVERVVSWEAFARAGDTETRCSLAMPLAWSSSPSPFGGGLDARGGFVAEHKASKCRISALPLTVGNLRKVVVQAEGCASFCNGTGNFIAVQVDLRNKTCALRRSN